LDELRLALDKYNLIRRHKFRNLNFKKYSYAESIIFILVKSQKYYAGQGQRSFSVLLILKASITSLFRPIFLPKTPFISFRSLSI
jgi:hypothetical protein